jgi:dihydroorotate dehydrogenase (fumarate)
MGIELKNPIIVGASNLVKDFNILKDLEAAGASAVVYKSLFEEQIQLEEIEFDSELAEYQDRHAEMLSLFPSLKHAGPEEHLMHLKKAKDLLNIPVFASLNCIFSDTWIEYAEKLEIIGVDGIELNFYAVPSDFEKEGAEIEKEQLEIVKAIMNVVKIPISVKLSPFYSNPLSMINKMDKLGVQAFVLFNKLFQPDFNIETKELTFPYNLSDADEVRLPMRFAGLLYSKINGSICGNTGIFSGKDVIKMILAGADAVQVVSTIYKNKPAYIATMLEDITKWMESKNYYSLNDFKGKMSKVSLKDPFAYKRAQYIDILMKSDEIFKTFPVR